MKRVLFISYFFPPLANSGTQRPLKFANYLPDYGWEPIVLTVEQPPEDEAVDPTLLQEVRPGTQVVRAPMFNDVIAKAIGRAARPIADPARVSSAISWRLRLRHQMPDLYAWWRPTARKTALRIFQETGFDAIFATGFPWTSLLVARDVSKATGRPFIADFRDPWTGEDLFMPHISKRARQRQRVLERSVLDSASSVVALAELLALDMKSVCSPHTQDRVVTITNGFDARDLQRPASVPAPPPGTRRIVYTGVWKDSYGLHDLYRAIATLDRVDPAAIANLEVVAAGFTPGHAATFGVERYVRELGRISHSACIGYMQTADALFLPVPVGKRQKQTPGKLYEYAASGRPILAMAHPEGELASFLDEVGGGVVIAPDDQDTLVNTVRQLCRDGKLPAPALNPNALARYERRALTGRLASLLDRAVA
jgi:glycosyltransferase involved in cell wall biosynthesis